ncbi:MAG: preprotein translocase subunit SecG [Rhodospirillaceae bacterium]|nr:preprotein translocase subunit SecG [Rhodospirillaceae bacterium]
MTAVLLVIHVIVAISMIVVILLQRSEGGALGSLGGGGGGGGGGFGGLMSGRQSANLLTRITTILAACFMGMSMLLAILASRSVEPTSILDQQQQSPAPIETPAEPAEPSAPVAQ